MLKARDVYTVEMMVELTEDDYIDMGFGRALVRNMLRKARSIVAPASAVTDDSPAMMLISLDAELA